MNLGTNFQLLAAEIGLFLPRLVAALLITAVFWFLARLVERLLRRVLTLRKLAPDLVQLVAQITSIVILIFGIVTALGTIGIDTGAMIAGLGLTGFALGFALKDAISNFLAGFMILLYQPFARGDLIKVADHEGTVVQINLRYTVLDAEQQRIMIPNAALLTNAVVIKRGGNPEQGTAPQEAGPANSANGRE